MDWLIYIGVFFKDWLIKPIFDAILGEAWKNHSDRKKKLAEEKRMLIDKNKKLIDENKELVIKNKELEDKIKKLEDEGNKIRLYSLQEKTTWLRNKIKNASNVCIVLNGGHLFKDESKELDLLKELEQKKPTVLVKSNTHSSLSNSNYAVRNWGDWPLNRLLTSSLSDHNYTGSCDFSVLKFGRTESVLFMEQIKKPRPKEVGTDFFNFACVECSKNEESSMHHPAADIASSFFHILNDLYSNIVEPLRKIVGTYIAKVKNSDGTIANVAIVRVKECNENIKSSKIPPGALIYEGMAFKRETNENNNKCIFWQTDALCIDLFALPVKSYPPSVLFKSDVTRIVVFKNNYAQIDSQEAFSNFGQLSFALKSNENEKPLIIGYFWDVLCSIEGSVKRCNEVIERSVELQPLEDALSNKNNLNDLNSTINYLWNQAYIANNTLIRQKEAQKLSIMRNGFNNLALCVEANNFCEMLTNLLTTKNYWKNDAVHMEYFK